MSDLTIKDLVALLDLKERGLYERAQRNQWSYKEIKGRGRAKRLYPFASLPQEVQLEVIKKATPELITKLTTTQGLKNSVAASLAQRVNEINKAQTPKNETIFKLPLRALTDERREGALEKEAWVKWFYTQKAERYKLKDIAMMLEQRKQAGEAAPSLRMLQYWVKAVDDKGRGGLIDQRWKSGRKTKITPEVEEQLISLIVHNPDARVPHLVETMRLLLGVDIKEDTLRQWLHRKKDQVDKRLMAFLINPDKAKRYLPYPGQAHGWTRLKYLDMIEWDGTPADVHCIDGRYTLMAAIDVATRQVQAILTKTSTAEASKMLLRQVILGWGKPKAFRGDQGSEFINSEIEWVFGNLDIVMMPAPPYSGESKPFIERFFGTLTRGLFEITPGYKGHNVADAQDIRSRLSFAKRKALEKEDEAVKDKVYYRVQLTATQLYKRVNQYLSVYHETVHSSLSKTPNQRLEELLPQTEIIRPDERELDILLSDQRTGKITAKGIVFKTLGESRIYTADEYINHIGQKVRIFIDPNPHMIHLFDFEGQYLFTAYDRAVDPKKALAARGEILENIHSRLEYYRDLAKQAGWDERDPHMQALEIKAAMGGERETELLNKINQKAVKESNLELAKAVEAAIADQSINQARETLKSRHHQEQAAEQDLYLDGYLRLQQKLKNGEKLTPDESQTMIDFARAASVRDYLTPEEQ